MSIFSNILKIICILDTGLYFSKTSWKRVYFFRCGFTIDDFKRVGK